MNDINTHTYICITSSLIDPHPIKYTYIHTYVHTYIHANANYSQFFNVFSLKNSLEEENRVTQECQELRTLSSNLQKEFQDLQHAYNNALSNGSAMEANIQALKQQLQKYNSNFRIIHSYVFICVCMYGYSNIHTYTYINACKYVYRHTCMYINICIHTYIHT